MKYAGGVLKIARALGPAGRVDLFEEVGVRAGYALEKGLELEPSGEVRSHQNISALGNCIGNFVRLAGGFDEQLRLAGTVHRDKPPGGLVDGVAYGQKAVIAQNRGFLRAEGAGDAVAFRSFFNNSGVIVEHDVIIVKCASVLRERIE